METLLVLGGSGLLGGKVAALASESFKVVATHRGSKPKIPGVDFVELSKEHVEEGMALVRKTKPSAVIHTAAMHNVDPCEEERGLAWQVDAGSTGSLARGPTDIGARYGFGPTGLALRRTERHSPAQDVSRTVNY